MNREISCARQVSAEIEAWLRNGGLVVAASERAARSLTAAYHRSRRAEGLAAWPTPNIQDWQTFVRNSWNERILDGRLVLGSLAEHAVWSGIVAAAAPQAAQLTAARNRLAALAMDAYSLLCAYAPSFLQPKARAGWDQDAAAFSAWIEAFDENCRAGSFIGPARLPLELIDSLESDSSPRPPLLLAGFDRILPTQRKFCDAWGSSTELTLGQPAAQARFHLTSDPTSELAACALWCNRQLAANPHARLLVVTQDVPKRRGEIERAFLRLVCQGSTSAGPAALFEFSLGISLSQIALVRSAVLLLHWFDGPIAEHELDWLLSSGYAAVSREESIALTAFMRALRRHNLQRTRWTLADFLRQSPGQTKLPVAWSARFSQAQHRLHEFALRSQTSLAWADFTPQLLELCGWPGARPLASSEFQALNRWQKCLDACASLGFDGRLIAWRHFLDSLDRAVDETLFAPESQDAPILVAGPAESAALTADAVWFLGACEDSWPMRGATNPLLPLAVLCEFGMPHASPQLDWDLAASITRRLVASAPQVRFSYARQSNGVDLRPSRLIVQLAGEPQPLPLELIAPPVASPLTVFFADASQIPFPPGNAPGGSSILSAQSQCPFKAFAVSRLAAQPWDPAQAGLTASERGQLLHEVLHSIWAGPPHGIRSHAELIAIPDLHSFVHDHVRRVVQSKMPARARQSMPSRYLELEAARLADLVAEWLRYESARIPFTVLDTELGAGASIAGLTLHLRLDRIDRLSDGSLLVIDYKTGDVKPKCWDLPRPDDVQLPLYADFALECDPGELGGLVFAKVRAGQAEFSGLLRDARKTLRGDLGKSTNLVKYPLASTQLSAWRGYIEKLANDFLTGRAHADPRIYPGTCDRCRLHSLCRIRERKEQIAEGADSNGEEVAND